MSEAWQPGTGDAAPEMSIREVDGPVAVAFVDQAKAAYGGAMSDYQTYQEQAEVFVVEYGADVVGGHSPVGVVPPAGSDPVPYDEGSTNQGPYESRFDPPSALTGG